MAQKLREANPEAFRNIVGRMLEAHGRGFWEADEEKLQKLRELYELTEDELEGVK
jgi:magnesium chelatase subunit H